MFSIAIAKPLRSLYPTEANAARLLQQTLN
jgi:hypothetical protein